MVIKVLAVTLLICSGKVPHDKCTEETAIKSETLYAPPGNIVCGVPLLVTVMDRPNSLDPDKDYVRARCTLKNVDR